MAKTRSGNNSDEEKEYSIIACKGSLFEKEEDPTVERSQKEADLLNNASESYQQFALSAAEKEQLAECDRIQAEIKQKTREMGLLQRQTAKQSRAIIYQQDIELAALLMSKMSSGHDITCQIDRRKNLIEVTINACASKDVCGVENLFRPSLKNEMWIKTKGRSGSMDPNERVIVTFRLRHRRDLIDSLKQQQELCNIPVVRNWY